MSVPYIESSQQVNDLCHLTDVWASGQRLLPNVTRWKKQLEMGNCRQQNSLQHSYALVQLGSIARLRLSSYMPNLDWQLLQDCLMVHDHGEGETGVDTLYHNKNEDQDLREYEAFCRRYRQLPREEFEYFAKAFLLQFCIRNPENFPSSARTVMHTLRATSYKEALLFEALERFDYVLYAWEQYQVKKNLWLLVGILPAQMPKLNVLCEYLPGFDQELWTSDVRGQMQQLVDDNPDLVKDYYDFVIRPDLK